MDYSGLSLHSLDPPLLKNDVLTTDKKVWYHGNQFT